MCATGCWFGVQCPAGLRCNRVLVWSAFCNAATWRRIKPIPFSVKIPSAEVDRKLNQKLLKELPGILNWALMGCRAWQREGLENPPAISHMIKQYRESSDVVGRWIDERCELGASYHAASGDLYRDHKLWCEQNGFQPLGSPRLSQKLKERFAHFRSKKARGFRGLKLRAFEAIPPFSGDT